MVSNVFRITMGPKGRLDVPTPLWHAIGVAPGDEIVALAAADGLLLLPRAAVKTHLRRMYANVKGSMADELLTERRADARLESRR